MRCIKYVKNGRKRHIKLKQKNFYSISKALCLYKSYDPAALTTNNISNSTEH